MRQRDFDELLTRLHDDRARLDDAHQTALRRGERARAGEIYACIVHIVRTVAHVTLAQSRRNMARAA